MMEIHCIALVEIVVKMNKKDLVNEITEHLLRFRPASYNYKSS